MNGKRLGSWGLVLAVVLSGLAACDRAVEDPSGGDGGTGGFGGTGGSGGSGGSGGGEGGTGGSGGSGGSGGIGGTGGGEGGTGGVIEGECAKAANVEYRAALVAAQPELGVRTRAVITATITWASLADDPAQECSVDLQFRDANGNGALDGYEDWTRTAEERAADLVGRLDAAGKAGLLAHPALSDRPTASDQAVTDATRALLAKGVRFGRTSANTSTPTQRATWANNLQALAEASDLGIPFVISSAPAHSAGNGRVKARGFSQWPQELAFGAGNVAAVEEFGRVVGKEFHAVGVRMLLGPSADLATDPRWFNGQFSFGEDAATVNGLVAAFVKGVQGETLGRESVAAVVGSFPGSGATKTGYDPRLAKGRFLYFSGASMDAHLQAFTGALGNGVAGVSTGHGIPEQGSWTALDGLVDGTAIEQVGVSFHRTLVTDVLRERLGFGGLVLSAWNVLEDEGGTAQGAPWGVEASTKAQRVAKAIGAGVDQFGGLEDPAPVLAAHGAGQIGDAQLDAAAGRALVIAFRLGLFENPYVDPARAPSQTDTDAAKRAGWAAQGNGMVLLVNAQKPAGWLNGAGDGSQTADKGNAGNGSGLILPAPPGEPYVSAGCRYFVMGNFDLDYVRTVSTGYGELTNDATAINGVPVTTEAERIARSDYVFIRISPPCAADGDSGALGHCTTSLEYGASAAQLLADVTKARAAIDALPGSKAQIVVAVDGGRPSVVSEILAKGVSGLFQTWAVTDKVFLDVAFGIVNGRGRLPVGMPASDTAAAGQRPDLPGDGTHPEFVRGHGFDINAF